jgi:PAS domain S-box-containing protein
VRTRIKIYALSTVVLLAAVLLRWLLDPILGDTLPLVTLFGAVTAAVWIGGHRPAMLVAVLGYVASAYLFIAPRGRLALDLVGNLVGAIAYLFTCSLIVAIGEAMRTAQARASERQELLRVTLASIGDAVITTDVGGRITYLNAVAESLTGWTQQTAAGRPLEAVFRIVNEETRQPVENPATRALQDGVVVGLANHTVLLSRQGGERPIDDSAAPIKDDRGNVSGCVLIFRDVSVERRAAQAKARQLSAARLLAAIVQSSDDAIISKSLDGIILSWNAGAERLFGHPSVAAVGRHISLVIPPDRIAEEDDIIASLRAGKPIEHFVTERVRADGQRLWVSLTISPIKDDEGKVVGASKIVRDVTRQRQAEAELAEADRRKTEFLAMLAHELRNPLAPISNAVQAMQLGAAGSGHAYRPALDMLERQVGQMVRLVDDLLDMSRISRGKIELRKLDVELGPIIDQAVEATRALYSNLNQEVTITMPARRVYLSGDPARLAQVFGNLLNNACKFTDPDGHVSLSVAQEGDQAVIRVRDDGIGIAAEQMPILFEMFQQADTSLERTQGGLGIGLTLVKTLVDMHGGTVTARSEGLGRGSEFEVRLPTLPEGPRAQMPATAEQPTPHVPRRILIVDDNEDGAESLAMLLEPGGHEIHKVHDGAKALEAAERLRPDVVLLDIGLPRMNGYEVCQRIRQEPWGRDLIVVALTGWGQEEDRQRSREAGFDAHLVKPVDYDYLAKLLARPRSARDAGTSIGWPG